MKPWLKYSIIAVLGISGMVNAYIYRDFVGGLLLGGALAVVYFSLTGSKLNFTFKKKI